MKIIYHPGSKIGFPGLDMLHPFDTNKFKRARTMLLRSHPELYKAAELIEKGEISRDELLSVHSENYLSNLGSSLCIARAIEVPLARYIPAFLLERCICRPMRRASQGTQRALEAALSEGVAASLGGGFHHAKPHRGEGFCLYADINLALSKVPGTVLYVDLDVHMGNGVAHGALEDPRVKIFDMFNEQIYPSPYDRVALDRIDHPVPILSGTTGRLYLERLKDELSNFFDSVMAHDKPQLVIYTAGTDVFDGDPLGGIHLKEDDVLTRDMLVYEFAKKSDIPFLYLPGGGYTKASAGLIANSLAAMLEAESQSN